MLSADQNPFRTACVEALAPRLDEPLPALVARFAAAGQRGLLAGPHGSGKTTTLEALAPLLGEVTWLRLRADRAHNRAAIALLPRLISGVLLLDGLEQLGPLAWWQVQRRAPRILATSHREHRLPLLHRHATHAPLLNELVVALGATPPADAELLIARHHGNLRHCLRELYDRVAAA